MIIKKIGIFINNKINIQNVQILNNKLYLKIIDKNDQNITEFKKDQNIIITPCFTDNHVHSRLEMNSDVNDVQEFIKTAQSGGYHHVVCLANLKNVPDTKEKLLNLRKIYQDYPEVYQVASVTKNLQGNKMNKIDELKAICKVFSDDGNPILNNDVLTNILKMYKKHDLLIMLHEQNCRLHSFPATYQCEWTDKNHYQYLADDYEYSKILNDLKINENILAKIHFQHVSHKKSLEAIKKYKKTQPITCEVTPHHLILSCDDIIKDNPQMKMNPPLVNRENQTALIRGLNEGTIDMISTDHAPHLPENKKSILNANYGVIGMQHAFSTLYTYLVKTKKVKLEIILKNLITKPQTLIFKKHVSFQEINEMPFNLINLDKTYYLNERQLIGKAKNSPWINHELSGEVFFINNLKKLNKALKSIKT